MVSGKAEMIGRKQLTFFKMIMLLSTAQDRLSLQNSKPYPVTQLACPITRSQYNRKLMAFNKKKTTSKEKQHKFIERIISRNSKIWIDITPQYVQSLYTSIPRGIMQVNLTKYQVRLLQLIFVFLLLWLVWFVMTCTNWALCDNFAKYLLRVCPTVTPF